MRVPRLASLAVAAILMLPASPLLPATTAAGQTGGLLSSEHIITTLYAYPGISIWNVVTSNAPAVGASIVDMCAADGSGSGCDGTPWKEQPPPAWATQIAALQNAGITPLVYIATDYGDAGGSQDFSLATVESEVSAAVGWYGRGIGFMFDQAGTSCDLESRYYGPLYHYVKSVTNDGTVELGPGNGHLGHVVLHERGGHPPGVRGPGDQQQGAAEPGGLRGPHIPPVDARLSGEPVRGDDQPGQRLGGRHRCRGRRRGPDRQHLHRR